MSEPKNQHYLPQFYLKGFTNPDVQGLLYILKNGHSYWMKRGIKSIASQDYLHSFRDDTGQMRHEIEEMFSGLETHFAPVLNKVLAQQDLSDDDRHFLSCFLMTMSQRVPGQVDHVNNQFSGLLHHTSGLIYSHYVQNPDDLEKMKLEYKKDTGRSDIDDLEPEDLNPSKYKIEANRNMTLLTMIQTATSMADILMQMGWTFLKSEPPHFFITSDYPFCLVDPTNKSQFYSGGLAHKNVEISMPLSRNIAFFAGWKSSGVRWLPVSEDFVEQINTRTVYFASREVIAPKQIFPGSAKLLANLPRLR